MNNKRQHLVFIITSLILIPVILHAQNQADSITKKYKFTRIIDLPASPVKDQASSGTCWSYATTSFLESEILRLTGDSTDLSEMFYVRKSYEAKARQYVRYHGTANFGQGGQAHDVINIMETCPLFLEKEYSGLANGQQKPDHSEMEAVLKAVLQAITSNPSGKLSPGWFSVINAILDVYLGPLPVSSEKRHSEDKISLQHHQVPDPNDYIEITSYQHHPFYSAFILEIPDNWSMNLYYNVPLEDLTTIMKYSLEKGYTIAWDGDVSDKGFSHKNSVAVVPDVSLSSSKGDDRARWEKLTEKERKQQFYSFESIVPERVITQQMRQEAFDNYSSTDDHLMHITGIAEDPTGSLYFTTKNSWGAGSNQTGGYLYLSEAYVKLNTIAILVHKDGIPKEISKKLNLK